MSSFLMSSGSKVTTVGWPEICGCKWEEMGEKQRQGSQRRRSGAPPPESSTVPGTLHVSHLSIGVDMRLLLLLPLLVLLEGLELLRVQLFLQRNL